MTKLPPKFSLTHETEYTKGVKFIVIDNRLVVIDSFGEILDHSLQLSQRKIKRLVKKLKSLS